MTVRTDDKPDQLQRPDADILGAPYRSAFEPPFAEIASENPPVGYATPNSLAPPEPRDPAARPRSVRTIAIIGFCFAAVAMINHGLGLSVLYVRGSSQSPEGLAGYWPVVDSMISVTLAIILLLSAYQAVHYKPSGRRAMIGWAVAHLVYLFIHAQVMFTIVIPATRPQMEKRLGLLNNSAFYPQSITMIYAVATLALIGIALYPIFVLVVMGRKSVRDQFEIAARR